jgi:ATP-binding cassette subfamily B multidrug efflux pump
MNRPATEKPLDFANSCRRLLSILRPETPLVLASLILTVASVVLATFGPRLLGRATDLIVSGIVAKPLHAGPSSAVPGRGIDFGRVGHVLLLVLAIYVCSAVCELFQDRLTVTFMQRSAFRLRNEAQAKLARLPLSYFDRQPHGELLSRVTNDIDNLQQGLQQTVSGIMYALLTIAAAVTMMVVVSPLLALISLTIVPVSIVASILIGRRAQPQFVKQWSTMGRLNGHIEEMYTGHSLVKMFGQRAEAERVFTEHNDDLLAASFRAQFLSGLIQPAMRFSTQISYTMIAVAGVLRVMSGSLSLGDVQASIQYSRQVSQPFMQLAGVVSLLQSSVASAERVFGLLDADEQDPDPEDPQRSTDVRGRIEFQDVSFRYQADKPLIDHLSLCVEPAQSVAIVGPTGAGKTTLVNLLMRFYEVTSGRIMVDGVDIATMSRERLRGMTGMVLQDTWLFGGTIAENIAFGANDADHDSIVRAARAAHADRFVNTLPDGYETVLDDEGTGVSTGEKELITIARAFLSEPTILILDEATSSVDSRTEVLIQRAMSSLLKGRTSLVIAHRLSTIREVDLILVMESGQIVEQGTHIQLLEARGTYAKLYAAQFAEID